MKKLLSLLSVLTISGTAIPTTIAASYYEKQEIKLENSELNYQQTNNLEKLNRVKRQYRYSNYNQYPSYQQSYNDNGYKYQQYPQGRSGIGGGTFQSGYNWGQRENINIYITNNSLGNLGNNPSDEIILNTLSNLNGFPSRLSNSLIITSRGSGFVRVTVDSTNLEYEGQVVVYYNNSLNINNSNLPTTSNHNLQIVDEPGAIPMTNISNLISHLGTIRGNLRTGLDRLVINRFLETNNLPLNFAQYFDISARSNQGRTARIRVRYIQDNEFKTNFKYQNILYYGEVSVDFYIFDEFRR